MYPSEYLALIKHISLPALILIEVFCILNLFQQFEDILSVHVLLLIKLFPNLFNEWVMLRIYRWGKLVQSGAWLAGVSLSGSTSLGCKIIRRHCTLQLDSVLGLIQSLKSDRRDVTFELNAEPFPALLDGSALLSFKWILSFHHLILL